jgi:hypothetical protein
MARIRRPLSCAGTIAAPSLVRVKRMLTSALLVTTFLGTAACGGGGDPEQAGASTSTSPSGGSSVTDEPSESPSASTDGSTGGSADVDCLVSGSPWQVSNADLESQFPQLMRGINVTSVHIAGHQTLTVDSGLHATFTDNTTTTISVDLSHGLSMVMLQKHHGSASGTWTAHEGKLVSTARWTGGIRGTTTVTINGRAGQAPFEAPSGGLENHPITFSCADGSLDLTVEGSPFSYLLTHA